MKKLLFAIVLGLAFTSCTKDELLVVETPTVEEWEKGEDVIKIIDDNGGVQDSTSNGGVIVESWEEETHTVIIDF